MPNDDFLKLYDEIDFECHDVIIDNKLKTSITQIVHYTGWDHPVFNFFIRNLFLIVLFNMIQN